MVPLPPYIGLKPRPGLLYPLNREIHRHRSRATKCGGVAGLIEAVARAAPLVLSLLVLANGDELGVCAVRPDVCSTGFQICILDSPRLIWHTP